MNSKVVNEEINLWKKVNYERLLSEADKLLFRLAEYVIEYIKHGCAGKSLSISVFL